jgi:sugar lactone lactonase YvrE
VERSKTTLSRSLVLVAALAIGLVALSACKSGGGSKQAEKLYSPQNEELDVYDLVTGKMTVLIPVTGWVNGQVCLVPDGSGSLLMAEDKNEEKGVRSGWSIFSKDGKFERKIPEPSSPTNEPKSLDPMGCAFDSQKRLFVTDVGEESFTGASGKLILFFPPDYTTYCILSDTLHTAGSVAIDDAGSVLVAETVPPGDVLRFSQPFPTDSDGCDTTPANKSVFIQDPNVGTPAGIARAPNGDWYVSSVFVPPAINEYDKTGKLVRNIVSGADIGNPEGIAVDSNGTIYYADLGLIQEPTNPLPHPGKGKGTVRKITFDKDGKPQPPQIMGSNFNFPDAVSVLKLP